MELPHETKSRIFLTYDSCASSDLDDFQEYLNIISIRSWDIPDFFVRGGNSLFLCSYRESVTINVDSLKIG